MSSERKFLINNSGYIDFSQNTRESKVRTFNRQERLMLVGSSPKIMYDANGKLITNWEKARTLQQEQEQEESRLKQGAQRFNSKKKIDVYFSTNA